MTEKSHQIGACRVRFSDGTLGEFPNGALVPSIVNVLPMPVVRFNPLNAVR